MGKEQTCKLTLEERKAQARAKRYKKPMLKDLNMEVIREFLWEAGEAASEIAYMETNEEALVDALGGDEEEAFEFRAAFSALSADMEQFASDLDERWIPDCFDDFFCGIGGDGGVMLGYDEMDNDYFGFDSPWEEELARIEAGKRLMRMTKAELIDAAGTCLRVALSYVALRSRYEDLRGSIDILRAQNEGLFSTFKRLEEIYNIAEREGFNEWGKATVNEWEQLISILPAECWLR